MLWGAARIDPRKSRECLCDTHGTFHSAETTDTLTLRSYETSLFSTQEGRETVSLVVDITLASLIHTEPPRQCSAADTTPTQTHMAERRRRRAQNRTHLLHQQPQTARTTQRVALRQLSSASRASSILRIRVAQQPTPVLLCLLVKKRLRLLRVIAAQHSLVQSIVWFVVADSSSIIEISVDFRRLKSSAFSGLCE